jgi:hypothetical protein
MLVLPAQQAAALHGHRQHQHAAQSTAANAAVAPDPYMAAIMEKLDKLTAAISGGSPLTAGAAAAALPTTALDDLSQGAAAADEVSRIVLQTIKLLTVACIKGC